MVTFAPTNKNVVFVRQRVTIMQARNTCMGFASLSEGNINICLKNVKEKKLKTHNKKLYKNKIFDAKQTVFDGL